jgi:GDPmannose 4,6-dehydratase
MARAFVTGITGQDGSYLAEALLDRGWEVHGLATSSPASAASTTPAGMPSASPASASPASGVTIHVGDLTDAPFLASVLDEVRPDLVVNLAGISSVAASWADPVRCAEVTGLAAVTLLELAWRLQERHGIPVRWLQASSAEIFGQPKLAAGEAISERTPIAPVSPYGAAKAFAHVTTGVYRTRGMHASTVILFNHESPRRPHAFVTRKITSTVAAIVQGRADKLVLGNQDARRDWGWAPDYVEAMVRAAEHDRADDFVVATGVAHSVGDFVAAAFAGAGIRDWASLVETDPALVRPTDPAVLVGDASKARAELGWTPTVGFEELVARMVAHDLGHSTDSAD